MMFGTATFDSDLPEGKGLVGEKCPECGETGTDVTSPAEVRMEYICLTMTCKVSLFLGSWLDGRDR